MVKLVVQTLQPFSLEFAVVHTHSVELVPSSGLFFLAPLTSGLSRRITVLLQNPLLYVHSGGRGADYRWLSQSSSA